MGYPIERYAIIYRIQGGDVLILRVAVVLKEAKAFFLPGKKALLGMIFVFYSPFSYNPGNISLGTERFVAYEVLAHRHLYLGRSDDNA